MLANRGSPEVKSIRLARGNFLVGKKQICRKDLQQVTPACCILCLTFFVCPPLTLGAGLDVAELAEMDIEALMDIKVISAGKKEQKKSET